MHIYAQTYTYTHIYIHTQRYDLKGSTLGRVATLQQRLSSAVVLKDIDLIVDQTKFRVGKDRKRMLEAQVCMCVYVYIMNTHICIYIT